MKFIVFLFVVFAQIICSATAMSEERSKCFSMEVIVSDYSGWKSDLHRFFDDYDNLKPDFRSKVLQNATKKILNLMTDLNKRADLKAWSELMSKSKAVVTAIEAQERNATGANKEMKANVVELEDAMADLIFQAQKKSGCQLEQIDRKDVKKDGAKT